MLVFQRIIEMVRSTGLEPARLAAYAPQEFLGSKSLPVISLNCSETEDLGGRRLCLGFLG